MTADGIVGKVLARVYPSMSQVLLINDQSSGVGAMLEKSRLQGVLRGTAERRGHARTGHERRTSCSPGETVLTSGGDQIFPKGLPVGTVSKVNPGKEMFLNIKVKPAANLSRLEEVLVVMEKQETAGDGGRTGRVRAADILAQRLPSVPDKPAADAKAASSGVRPLTAAAGVQRPAKPKSLQRWAAATAPVAGTSSQQPAVKRPRTGSRQ